MFTWQQCCKSVLKKKSCICIFFPSGVIAILGVFLFLVYRRIRRKYNYTQVELSDFVDYADDANDQRLLIG